MYGQCAKVKNWICTRKADSAGSNIVSSNIIGCPVTDVGNSCKQRRLIARSGSIINNVATCVPCIKPMAFVPFVKPGGMLLKAAPVLLSVCHPFDVPPA